MKKDRRGYWWHWGWHCPVAAGRALQGSRYCSYGSPGTRLCSPRPASMRNPESSPNSHACSRHSWPAEGDKPFLVHQSQAPDPALDGCLPSWPCLVASSLVSAVRVCGAWQTWFWQMPPDATATNGTSSAPSSSYSSTARSPCSGSAGGEGQEGEGMERLHSINSQHSHHQEQKLLLSPDLRAFRMN